MKTVKYILNFLKSAYKFKFDGEQIALQVASAA